MSNVKIIVNIYSITCLLGPYLMRIILSLSQAWMRIVSIRYGRGDGQQRGQEAAALHDDGGEVQHEVGETVQPGGAHLVWDKNLQQKNNSTALLMKNFCERKSILIVKPNMVRHLTLAEQELHLQLGTRGDDGGVEELQPVHQQPHLVPPLVLQQHLNHHHRYHH